MGAETKELRLLTMSARLMTVLFSALATVTSCGENTRKLSGKPDSALARFRQSRSDDERGKAFPQLMRMPSSGLMALKNALLNDADSRDGESPWIACALTLRDAGEPEVVTPHLAIGLRTESDELRRLCGDSAYRLGTRAATLAPDLAAVACDPTVQRCSRDICLEALRVAGDQEAARGAFLRVLDTTNEEMLIDTACRGIADMGDEAVSALPRLLVLLGEERGDEPPPSMYDALAACGGPAIDPLLEMVGDPSVTRRRRAARALLEDRLVSSADDRHEWRRLDAALHDENEEVRLFAISAVAALPLALERTGMLVEIVQSPTEAGDVRAHALRELFWSSWRRGCPEAMDAQLPLLEDSLQDHDTRVRRQAPDNFGVLSRSVAAYEFRERIARGHRYSTLVRERAILALSSFESRRAEIVELFRIVSDENIPDLSKSVALALRLMDSRAMGEK
ncbi:MAG: hypothetical protein HY719_02015 [Planctomycetes bacterium]|nr:hypothetical protein [Planctomycetota bacterium]